MMNGLKSDKSARVVAREISLYRAQARAAKFAARVLAADTSDYLDAVWASVDAGAYADGDMGAGPDSDE
jgi:hypothetical protein